MNVRVLCQRDYVDPQTGVCLNILASAPQGPQTLPHPTTKYIFWWRIFSPLQSARSENIFSYENVHSHGFVRDVIRHKVFHRAFCPFMGANAIAGRPASNWSKHSVIKFEGGDSIIQVEAQCYMSGKKISDKTDVFLHIVEKGRWGQTMWKNILLLCWG